LNVQYRPSRAQRFVRALAYAAEVIYYNLAVVPLFDAMRHLQQETPHCPPCATRHMDERSLCHHTFRRGQLLQMKLPSVNLASSNRE
jgi:hypothetical protein